MDGVVPFSVDRSEVLKTLLLSPTSGWAVWALLASGTILVFAGCFFDVRLLVLGLMVCVAITPGLMALLYFSHSLAPDIVPNLLPHTVERNDEGFLIRLWRRQNGEDDGEDGPTEDSEDAGGWVQSAAFSLQKGNIVNRKTTIGYDVFYFKDSPMKILYVPRF